MYFWFQLNKIQIFLFLSQNKAYRDPEMIVWQVGPGFSPLCPPSPFLNMICPNSPNTSMIFLAPPLFPSPMSLAVFDHYFSKIFLHVTAVFQSISGIIQLWSRSGPNVLVLIGPIYLKLSALIQIFCNCIITSKILLRKGYTGNSYS